MEGMKPRAFWTRGCNKGIPLSPKPVLLGFTDVGDMSEMCGDSLPTLIRYSTNMLGPYPLDLMIGWVALIFPLGHTGYVVWGSTVRCKYYIHTCVYWTPTYFFDKGHPKYHSKLCLRAYGSDISNSQDTHSTTSWSRGVKCGCLAHGVFGHVNGHGLGSWWSQAVPKIFGP